MKKLRKVIEIIDPEYVMEGAGDGLRRSIGTQKSRLSRSIPPL